MFIYTSRPDQDVAAEVALALQLGAAAIMSSEPFESEEDVQVPVLLVPDALQAQQRVAAAFYELPSIRMNVVGVTGLLLLMPEIRIHPVTTM